jgi:formamidopyrimidine-DNA glycosylase
MPELPDVVTYVEALRRHVVGQPLQEVRLFSPFLLRSVDPPITAVAGKAVRTVARLGKRIVVGLDDDLYLILHLMIAGRLRWRPPGAKSPGKIGLAAFDFPDGTLLLTEAGSKKRASLHLVRGAAAVAAHDPGGIEVLDADRDAFAAVLAGVKHTVKRALTDPHLFSGIGNAYSDEILHRARLSPFKTAPELSAEEVDRLYNATREVLHEWVARLGAEVGDGFPETVTAFHPAMAVHGRYGKPCPVCGAPVQRIVYASNEANYCAKCQTDGRVLADRALSRLLKKDWPRRLEDLERLRPSGGGGTP